MPNGVQEKDKKKKKKPIKFANIQDWINDWAKREREKTYIDSLQQEYTKKRLLEGLKPGVTTQDSLAAYLKQRRTEKGIKEIDKPPEPPTPKEEVQETYFEAFRRIQRGKGTKADTAVVSLGQTGAGFKTKEEIREKELKTAISVKTLENKLNELKLTDLGVTKKLQSSTIKEFSSLVKSNMKSSVAAEEGVFDITEIDPVTQKEFEVSTLSFMHDLAKTEEKRNAIEGILLGLLDEAFERDVVDRFTSFDEAVSAYKQWLTELF